MSGDVVDGDIWLKVESFNLFQALGHLAARVVGAFKVFFSSAS